MPDDYGTALGIVTTLFKSDTVFKYLNAVDTSLAVQEYLSKNSQKRFGQTRFTTGDPLPGFDMANKLSVKAHLIGLYSELLNMGLVQGGKDVIRVFKENIKVSFDDNPVQYDVYVPIAIVS